MNMELDINNEIEKLHKITYDKEIPLFENYDGFLGLNIKIKYLLYILELTYDRPETEIYLEQLLKNYSITELSNLFNDNNILHYMTSRASHISLNSFEIIINFGINVNKQNGGENTPIHFIQSINFELSQHELNVIGLFVNHGADLNILNHNSMTILDYIVGCDVLTKHLEIIIGTLLDFGAKTNKPDVKRDSYVLEFIESYRCNDIKPAIKK